MTIKTTLSTEQQRPGDATRPDDTMDRQQTGAEADNLGKNTQEDDAGSGAAADNMGANQADAGQNRASVKDSAAHASPG